MANWILFSRDASGKPIVSAMKGGTTEESLNSEIKDNLIEFLKRFSGASTFVVTKPNGDGKEIEAVALLPLRELDKGTATSTVSNATWFHFFRVIEEGQPVPVIVAMNGSGGVEYYKGNRKQDLIAFLLKHPNAKTFKVAPADTPIPEGIPQVVLPIVPPPSKHRVMLEIGHGPGDPFDPGAIAHDGTTTEHELNIIAANAAQKVLVAAGVNCIIIDTPQGELYDMGLKASGYDVFCSVHHNSYNGIVQRAEAFSHQGKGGKLDNQLAGMISLELSQTLGIKNGGAKQARFGVLSGAEDTNVRVAVLAEVYFIDYKGGEFPKPPLKDYSTRGGEAIGRAILEWLKKNPK